MEINGIYFTIGQVSEHVNLPQSVLRYWETVFDALKPQKSKGGNRRYRKKDIEIIQKIKELLYEEGFTIKGANKQLNSIYNIKSSVPEIESPEKATENAEQSNTRESSRGADIIKIKQRLQEIIRILEEDE